MGHSGHHRGDDSVGLRIKSRHPTWRDYHHLPVDYNEHHQINRNEHDPYDPSYNQNLWMHHLIGDAAYLPV